jgi:hypothetical protein
VPSRKSALIILLVVVIVVGFLVADHWLGWDKHEPRNQGGIILDTAATHRAAP